MSFYCEKLSSTLSESLCEQRYKSKKFMTCSSCEIGAERAGQKVPVNLSRFCSRCQKNTLTLVHKRLCKSCYNREGESRRGFDRRHNPVKKIPVLEVFCDSGVFKETAKSLLEVLTDLLRQQIKTVHSFIRPIICYQYDLFFVFC